MSEPTVNTFLARIQTDPQGDNPSATAFFGETTTLNGKTFEAAWQSVSWPLHGTDKSTTINGVTLTDAQVAAFVVAIAEREFAANAASQ